MREIKFRYIFDTKDGLHIEKLTLETIEKGELRYMYLPKQEWVFKAKNQYTGLKDKNGKEIYEGDIIKSTNYEPELKDVVEFKNGSFAMEKIITALFQNSIDYYNFTIIGNIYESPELLEVK